MAEQNQAAAIDDEQNLIGVEATNEDVRPFMNTLAWVVVYAIGCIKGHEAGICASSASEAARRFDEYFGVETEQ